MGAGTPSAPAAPPAPRCPAQRAAQLPRVLGPLEELACPHAPLKFFPREEVIGFAVLLTHPRLARGRRDRVPEDAGMPAPELVRDRRLAPSRGGGEDDHAPGGAGA